jgi:hypothetical protein
LNYTIDHNNETVGEWSDDMIDKIQEKLKKSISKSQEKIAQNETFSVIAKFLPDPIRETLSS